MKPEEKFTSPRVEESGGWNLVSPSSGERVKVCSCAGGLITLGESTRLQLLFMEAVVIHEKVEG